MRKTKWEFAGEARTVLVLLAALATAGAGRAGAAAEREVARSGPAPADGTVTIENIAGSIEVQGWERNEIDLKGTLGADVEDLEFSTGKKSVIKVVYPRRAKNIDEGADLVIKVPAGSRLEIDGISCPIGMSGLTGRVFVSSISGEVRILGDPQSIDAESISGDVTVDGRCGQISVQSISGRVTVACGTAAVDASTVSGSLLLEAESFKELNVESVAGEAEVSGALAGKGSFSFDLHSGDLTLAVPAGVSADFSVETFSGDITNDFGAQPRKVSTYAPGRELEFTAGQGEARVQINTFSGDVNIRKR